ncbi:phage terminase small subunit P27 family [Halopseudomonas phragmitis]|uniref:Terminase n=1 Tax=Halopseudomonas phragmitis TaxID=1931241 RepID=A0A1V0B9G1_9GAMM|nr:phage terminase small subunit P27 family [Halopseudomonas phragmitis]AQZ96565.1 terminase [Halopseudomonas phragmitis]
MAGNANSGRHAKPAIVHVLTGNKSKLPAHKLQDEMQASPLPVEVPAPPDWLDDDACAEWERVGPDLVLLGLVTRLDRQALAQYCEAVSDYRRWTLKIQRLNDELEGRGDVMTYRTGAKDLSIWRKLRNDAERRADAAGAKFGFSPLARRNLRAQLQAPQGELFPNEQKEIAQKYF